MKPLVRVLYGCLVALGMTSVLVATVVLVALSQGQQAPASQVEVAQATMVQTTVAYVASAITDLLMTFIMSGR